MNKEALIEKYRYINVEYDDWWHYVEIGFKEKALISGINVDKIYFNGFYSQGDGACFDGYVADWRLFLQSIGYNNPVLIGLAKGFWGVTVKRSSRNCIMESAYFDIDIPNPYSENDDEQFAQYCSPYSSDDVLRNASWLAVLRAFNYDSIEQDIKQAFIDLAGHLYRELRAEYEWLTSDEEVWKSIVANGLDKAHVEAA